MSPPTTEGRCTKVTLNSSLLMENKVKCHGVNNQRRHPVLGLSLNSVYRSVWMYSTESLKGQCSSKLNYKASELDRIALATCKSLTCSTLTKVNWSNII